MEAMTIDSRELKKFVTRLLCSAGVDSQEASIIADAFVWTDLVARHTHGVQRLSAYLRKFGHGLIRSPCNPEFIQQSETFCILDGHSGFGQYLGHVAMSRAIEIADAYGTGLVGVRHSNHFGAACYYVQMAAQNSKIGLAFSNSVPHVAPHGGVSAILGTNPFAFGAPTRNGESVLVDFSTGASSGAMIVKAAKENREIPEGIVIGENGQPIVDAKEAVGGVILPFGGAKGFCLGLMIEIMSGVITGAGISAEVASLHKDLEHESNVGHCFIAIDIACAMPLESYYERMEWLIGAVKNSKRRPGTEEIRIPGEIRWRKYARQLTEGISLSSAAIEALSSLAHNWGVSTPW